MSLPDSIQSQDIPQNLAPPNHLIDDELDLVKNLYLSGVPPFIIAQVIRCLLNVEIRTAAYEVACEKENDEGNVGVAIDSLADVRHRLIAAARMGNLEEMMSSASAVAGWIFPGEERQAGRQRNGSVTTQVSVPPSYTTDPRS
ncbi:hypothetical protein CONPUDRAFT_162680 [Coniophora puteana RWD-64-598 SS2]|uniref:Uncharacterized protein n=1 Tax=Coniophora puteana (strain RWD-64-598) TaxID=741705 RepID=A0A5M3N395_CONPW|nr:uncharacterized protein CONPUDRAFT_162680 [Coniophora puteana RWD-64-598 SS2]EIW85494.1 hypothetical protein CONPUDRAFT_162680 [Coniophora puteana RWD-64-598 SS2]